MPYCLAWLRIERIVFQITLSQRIMAGASSHLTLITLTRIMTGVRDRVRVRVRGRVRVRVRVTTCAKIGVQL